MSVEFSALEMPISAPGAEQLLVLLEKIDAKAQAAATHVTGALRLPSVAGKAVEEAGGHVDVFSRKLEHMSVQGAFAFASLAEGAEQGVRPFAHSLATLGGLFGGIGLAVTTFVAVGGEALLHWLQQ